MLTSTETAMADQDIPALDLAELGERLLDEVTGATRAPLPNPAGLVLAMTAHHAATLRRLAPDAADRVHMFRSFDPAAPAPRRDSDLDVADPWYGGPEDFELCLDEVEAAVDGLMAKIRTGLARQSR